MFNLTNMGRPNITVVDGNHKNRGELLLEHCFNGVELKIGWAEDTLANLFRLWKRPVHIKTVLEEHEYIVSFDGTEATRTQLEEAVLVEN